MSNATRPSHKLETVLKALVAIILFAVIYCIVDSWWFRILQCAFSSASARHSAFLCTIASSFATEVVISLLSTLLILLFLYLTSSLARTLCGRFRAQHARMAEGQPDSQPDTAQLPPQGAQQAGQQDVSSEHDALLEEESRSQEETGATARWRPERASMKKSAIAWGATTACIALLALASCVIARTVPVPSTYRDVNLNDFIEEHRDIEKSIGTEIVGPMSTQETNAILQGIAADTAGLCDHVAYENATPDDDGYRASWYTMKLYPTWRDDIYAQIELTRDGRLEGVTYHVGLDMDLGADGAVNTANDDLCKLVDIVSQSSYVSAYYPYVLDLTYFSQNATNTVLVWGFARADGIADAYGGRYSLVSSYDAKLSPLRRLTGQAEAALTVSIDDI